MAEHNPVYTQTHNISGKRLTFSLHAEGRQLLDSLGQHGRKAVTLAKQDDLSIVLMAIRGGDKLAEHSAPGTVTIHLLQGHAKIHLPDEDVDAHDGFLVQIADGLRHDVEAVTDSLVLITVASADHPAAS
ncbi:hypothetical protein J0H33_13780 [bacterium]|jgi:quercetin dioxygenase-like cupin family protein|nr:hypothetical protein [bacterium]